MIRLFYVGVEPIEPDGYDVSWGQFFGFNWQVLLQFCLETSKMTDSEFIPSIGKKNFCRTELKVRSWGLIDFNRHLTINTARVLWFTQRSAPIWHWSYGVMCIGFTIVVCSIPRKVVNSPIMNESLLDRQQMKILIKPKGMNSFPTFQGKTRWAFHSRQIE